ncbi:MAG: hypothetical protein E7038_04320 [Lentisphaerae bacterium]|nr:hypothetical protein [Lentisphaerota bacterium]
MKEKTKKIIRGSITALLMLSCVAFCTAETGGCGGGGPTTHITDIKTEDGGAIRIKETTSGGHTTYSSPTYVSSDRLESERENETLARFLLYIFSGGKSE